MSRRLQLLVLAAVALVPACHRDMRDQARIKPLEASAAFADGRSARPAIPGTIARGELNENAHLHTGRIDGELAQTLPMPVSRQLLERGRQRYLIFCSPCHDGSGGGRGLIVERGMRQPPSLHEARLIEAGVGHYFDVMTRGFGAMYSYASRVSVEDRWAIAAYIRVLQYSRRARLEDLSADDRRRLEQP